MRLVPRHARRAPPSAIFALAEKPRYGALCEPSTTYVPKYVADNSVRILVLPAFLHLRFCKSNGDDVSIALLTGMATDIQQLEPRAGADGSAPRLQYQQEIALPGTETTTEDGGPGKNNHREETKTSSPAARQTHQRLNLLARVIDDTWFLEALSLLFSTASVTANKDDRVIFLTALYSNRSAGSRCQEHVCPEVLLH